MHLLRLLPGGLPGRCHRRGPELRIRHRNARGAFLRQGQTSRQRRPLGGRDRPQPRTGRAVQVRKRTVGAWGLGAFEDDAALDWRDESFASTGVQAVIIALQAASKTSPDDYLEYVAGVEARAAAEVVAIAFGKPASGTSHDDINDVKPHVAEIRAIAGIRPLALKAMNRVSADNSEIAELWRENGPVEFDQAIADLINRLGGAE
ncbi:MAG: hypothetical protein B7Z02_15650 [Rhodobacterales bacterium 32-67-9]|nr:MAG: hypothetical protein B7Z02_15650 [Rhodobacterales bacterium 32-67-9]